MNRVALTSFLFLLCHVHTCAQQHFGSRDPLANYLRQEIAAGHIVGAQALLASTKNRNQDVVNLGTIGPEDPRPVSDATVFCLASCSKPIASTIVFTLLDDRQMSLNQRSSDLIPGLSSLTMIDGTQTRAPTLRELLSHRGGIYSQQSKLTKPQLAAIRDFRLSLDESVQIIAKQPLTSPPGTNYAYSGAGYILVGLMAEEASGDSVETLLHEKICQPLQMNSTTYLPDVNKLDEIAMGGRSQLTPPHTLGTTLALPLVGGSIYSTAKDLEKFSRMILHQGRAGRERVLSKQAWSHLISPAFPSQAYGYGWRLSKRGNAVVALSHGGSLPPYQSAIRIDLANKTYGIALWTLAEPRDVQSTIRIRKKVEALINR